MADKIVILKEIKGDIYHFNVGEIVDVSQWGVDKNGRQYVYVKCGGENISIWPGEYEIVSEDPPAKPIPKDRTITRVDGGFRFTDGVWALEEIQNIMRSLENAKAGSSITL